MAALLTIIHILVCIALVIVVLLQTGKGAEIGATFGGGSNTLFGSRGAGNFMTKATAVAGAVFMLTSLALAMMSSDLSGGSVVGDVPAAQEAAPAPAPAPESMPPVDAGAPFGSDASAEGAPAAPAPGNAN